MKNVYPDPGEVLDHILEDEEIIKRAVSVTKNYDSYTKAVEDFHYRGKGTMKDVKKKLFLAMMNVNILEGLRFYVSFACTFAFAESKMMEGSAKIISLIARDEATHLNLSTHVLKNWLRGNDDPEIQKLGQDSEEEVYEMWKTCVEEEKAWAKYLFKDGSIIGLNEVILGQYVEFIANRRLKALGYKPIFDQPVNTNPLPWTQKWIAGAEVQVAPQETEISSYVIGGTKQDVNGSTFQGMKL